MTTPTAHDPVSRVRMAFERAGDDLVVHIWLGPGGGLPAHLHPQQTEIWSAVEGRARFLVGDEWREIAPEDGEVVVTPGTVHGVAAVEDREVRLQALVQPALHLQEFLEESARAAQAGLFTAKGRPRGLRGARWAARFLKRYGDETVFVKPPQPVQRLLIALLARG
jgi:quercetin dioxygenase-like cupin family protein